MRPYPRGEAGDEVTRTIIQCSLSKTCCQSTCTTGSKSNVSFIINDVASLRLSASRLTASSREALALRCPASRRIVPYSAAGRCGCSEASLLTHESSGHDLYLAHSTAVGCSPAASHYWRPCAMNCQRVGGGGRSTSPDGGHDWHISREPRERLWGSQWKGPRAARAEWVQMGTAATLQTSASVLSPAVKPPSSAVLRNILADLLEAVSPPACWLGSCQHLHRAFGGNALDLRSQGAYCV